MSEAALAAAILANVNGADYPAAQAQGDAMVAFADAVANAVWNNGPPGTPGTPASLEWVTVTETITTGNQDTVHRYYDLPTALGDGIYIYECVGLYVATDGTYSFLQATVRFLIRASTFTRLVGGGGSEPALTDAPQTQGGALNVVTTTSHHPGYCQADFSFTAWHYGAGCTLVTSYRLKGYFAC